MKAITIATFNEASKAQPLKQRLEEFHIPAEIHDESTMERLWFVARPIAGVRLKVHASDFENALRLLQELDQREGILRDAIRCPECGSSRVEYPQFTRKFILPNLIGLLAGLGLVEKEFYCQNCQYTWPKEGKKPSKARPHMAPYYFLEGIPQPPTEPAPKSGGG
jgi:hypothetical protein